MGGVQVLVFVKWEPAKTILEMFPFFVIIRFQITKKKYLRYYLIDR
jgi:hypothetical protein